jgi:hypothetical protein
LSCEGFSRQFSHVFYILKALTAINQKVSTLSAITCEITLPIPAASYCLFPLVSEKETVTALVFRLQAVASDLLLGSLNDFFASSRRFIRRRRRRHCGCITQEPKQAKPIIQLYPLQYECSCKVR